MTFKDFVKELYPDFIFNWHHDIICQQIDNWLSIGNSNLMILSPPKSSKSTLCAVALPAYIHNRNNESKVLCHTYSDSAARARERELRRVQIQHNLSYSGTKFSHVGMQLSSCGYNKCIIDDPNGYRIDADQEKRIWSWYTGSCLTRLYNDASKLIICSVWPRSLVRSIINSTKNTGEIWNVVKIPALRSPIVSRSNNMLQSYWESQYPVDWLLDRKDGIGEDDWRMLYQQEFD